MTQPNPSPHEAPEPGGDERPLDERSAAGRGRSVEEHHFELPIVAPVQRPGPDESSQW
jgi:hypothetical protein